MTLKFMSTVFSDIPSNSDSDDAFVGRDRNDPAGFNTVPQPEFVAIGHAGIEVGFSYKLWFR
jgi:hypothetical protein